MDGGLADFGASVQRLITADRSLLSLAEWVEFARVENLRSEAKGWRLKAQRAEHLETALRTLAIESAARGVITDPAALEWSQDWADDDGMPDLSMIRAAALVLAI